MVDSWTGNENIKKKKEMKFKKFIEKLYKNKNYMQMVDKNRWQSLDQVNTVKYTADNRDGSSSPTNMGPS